MATGIDKRLRGLGTAYAAGVPLGSAFVDLEAVTSGPGRTLVRGRVRPQGWNADRSVESGVVDLLLQDRTYRLSPTRTSRFSRWLSVIGYEETATP